jgi:hypothetical protein
MLQLLTAGFGTELRAHFVNFSVRNRSEAVVGRAREHAPHVCGNGEGELSTASIEDQIRLCCERVANEGGTAIETYTDYAISGDSLKNRPGIRALLSGAKSFKFDCVIAEALDRISRDQEDIAGIYKRNPPRHARRR